MNQIKKSIWGIAAALAIGLVSCGPPEDMETEIEVSTSEEGGSFPTPDTVIRETTVVPPADTVTVVERQTDTVVRTVPGRVDTVNPSPPRSTVSASERARIDAWLRTNDATLNQYGDPEGTVYTGGTPLFNEATGTMIDRYDYIVRQHPDRPWMQSTQTESTPRR